VSEIAAAAAEHVDAESFEVPLTEVVGELVSCLDRELAVDVAPLRNAGADGILIGRLLRAAEMESIELLRANSNGKLFAGNVLRLRACIRKSLPPSLLNLEQVKLYQDLVAGVSRDAHPENQRIFDFFTGILHNVRDLIFVLDANGNFLYINDAGLDSIRYTRDDLLDGLSIYDVVVSKYIDLVEERMSAPGAGKSSPFTIEVYAKDGGRIPMEIDTGVLMDQSGGSNAVVGIARDLRLERRFQSDIRRLNCSMETLLDIAPLGVLIADADGSIRESNALAAAMCGAPTLNALIGLNLSDLGESQDSAGREALNRVVDARKDFRACMTFRTRFGKKMHCDVIAAPLELEDGSLDGVVMLLVDIAEQKAMQQELLQSEKMSALGEIAARVAHELNNPLSGILGYTEFLLQTAESETLRGRLERIVEEADRCRRVGENLLAFARRGERSMEPQDVNELVRQAYSLFEYTLQIDSIKTDLALAPDLPSVLCNAQDVQRVFLNIINNAHRALLDVNPERRNLSIATRLDDDEEVRVSFTDTGIGIDDSVAPKIFQPFFTTRDVGEGIGLGLSVGYAIIADHGGKIEFDSSKGKGATFTIVLPVRS
jgi:two-component system NtrC family sensor kinase